MLKKVILFVLLATAMASPTRELVIKNWDQYANEEINPLEPTPLRKLQIYVRGADGGEYKLLPTIPRKRGSLLDNLESIGYYYK